MARNAIRSIWSADGARFQVVPVAGDTAFGALGPVPVPGSAGAADCDSAPQCLLTSAETHGSVDSYLVVRAGAGRLVLLNGRAIPGGIARVEHGCWLRVDGRRFWLSSEGPARLAIAAPGALDAMTLEPLLEGSSVVRCACDALYAPEVWAELRACVLCDYREDGRYTRTPPGVVATAGAAR